MDASYLVPVGQEPEPEPETDPPTEAPTTVVTTTTTTILFQMRTTLLYESVIGNRVPFQEMKNRPCRMCCLVRAVL